MCQGSCADTQQVGHSLSRAEQIAASIAVVQSRISTAAKRAGREPQDVQLIVVTKTRSVDEVRAVIAAGVVDLGENRATELADKSEALAGDLVRWHMIGQCQTNKVGRIAEHVELWQSVDRESLVEAISIHAPGARILVQVNTSGDAKRGGVGLANVPKIVDFARTKRLEVRGLMAIAPLAEDPRRCFDAVSELAKRLSLQDCSIGMSNDFEEAIECGATMVRVGSIIFS